MIYSDQRILWAMAATKRNRKVCLYPIKSLLALIQVRSLSHYFAVFVYYFSVFNISQIFQNNFSSPEFYLFCFYVILLNYGRFFLKFKILIQFSKLICSVTFTHNQFIVSLLTSPRNSLDHHGYRRHINCIVKT